MTSEINWLVEEYINDDDTRLVEEIKRQGYTVKILPHAFELDAYKANTIGDYFYKTFFPEGSRVIFHGSTGTTRLINRYVNWNPGTFFNEKDYLCSRYYRKYKGYLLNEDYICMPLYEALDHINSYAAANYRFIRPDSPYKTFPGHVISPIGEQMFLRKYCLTEDNLYDWVYLSPVKKIYYEMRLLFVGGKFITGSFYRKDGETCYETMTYPDGISWLPSLPVPNTPIIVDIASTILGFKVVEIGSVTSCSLYECDMEKVVSSLSNYVSQMEEE